MTECITDKLEFTAAGLRKVVADFWGWTTDERCRRIAASTLCRLENRITRQTNVALSKILVDQFIASHDTPPKKIVLDFDATDDPVHGTQLGRVCTLANDALVR